MLHWFRSLDRVLRGQATSTEALKANQLDVPIWGLCVLIDLLGLLYGLCMGIFDLTNGGPNAWKQALACTFKVPALFLLTLMVTLPSLYVFNAMVGSRLTLKSMVRLMIASLAVMLAVLASIGPIVAFFSFTTTSYPFMILLNVLVFAVAGSLGMLFLLQSLHRITVLANLGVTAIETIPPDPLPEADFAETPEGEGWAEKLRSTSKGDLGPLQTLPNHGLGRGVRGIFQIWVLVFGLVGMQMAWVLSPFLGHPDKGFVLFRERGSNFFQGVMDNTNHLMGWENPRGRGRE
jgi:hypothetical protein